MYNFESEKHCPKCGGKMINLVLTSYPGQSISKCWKCGYREDLKNDVCKYPNNKNNGLVKIELLNNVTE